MLKFRAVHFDQGARVPKQYLCRRFHNARLARTGRPQKQQISHRAARRIQSGAEDLIEIHKRFDGLVLPHDLPPQRILKIARRETPLSRVQLFPLARLRCCCHNIPFTVVTRTQLEHDIQFQSPETPRSLVTHSRMYAGQFSSWMLSASQRARNFTASRSTSVTSFKSKTRW